MNKRYLLIGAAAVVLLAVLTLRIFTSLNSRRLKVRQPEVVTGLLNKADELEEKTDLRAAKAIYQRLISEFPDSELVERWQKKIDDLNMKMLFSPTITEGSIRYEIKPRDTLHKIAGEFNTTVELIKRANNLKSDKIFPGKKIKIYAKPFNIFVDKSQNTLILKSNGEVVKTYVVSTGLYNSTPVGTFKIKDKLINPTWYTEGKVIPANSPENILGSRWLGFDLAGYGIHGTTNPKTLGSHVTQGCVRMSNQDVEELFSIIPLGTEVVIAE